MPASAGMPASVAAAAPGPRQPSSCQRTRSATAASDSSPSCRQRLELSRPSAQMTRTWIRMQVSPRAARTACICSASALAANTTGSASDSGGLNSWATDRSSAGGRTASGREPRPRDSRCKVSPAAPNRLATSLAGSVARSPSVRRPSLVSSAIRSWSARPWPARALTGCPARNSAVRPGGMTRTGSPSAGSARAGPASAGLTPAEASRAANSPSATPTRACTPDSATAAMSRLASAVSPPK
jgi:hypothetical protein